MKKAIGNFLLEIMVFSFMALLLFFSNDCVSFASNGLLIWFQKMIPSLFPFMIISGFMIRSGLSYKMGIFLQPVLGIIFRLPSQMLYVIFMGFLCGFPMGAKLIADMLENKQITLKDGQFLLAFCNNIGPLYLLGYVLPLFHWNPSLKLFFLMYGIPVFYGLCLRYFSPYTPEISISKESSKSCESKDYPSFLYQSLINAIEQITLLGGCMIFFNCLQIFPSMLDSYITYSSDNVLHNNFIQGVLRSLLEIGGGLSYFSSFDSSFHFSSQLISLMLLTFGGLSCIFQTYLIIQKTNLKITDYIKHKLIQILLIFFVYIIIEILNAHIIF